MMPSQVGSIDIDKLIGIINRIVDSIKSTEQLSQFELGQRDGLLWVVDVLNSIKSPEE